jgi:hypothetical protein
MLFTVATGRRSRQTLVTRNLADVGIVNDDFSLGDTRGQELADALPGDGIEVVQVTDEPFRIHGAIDDFSCIEGLFRKRQQMRQLFLIEI